MLSEGLHKGDVSITVHFNFIRRTIIAQYDLRNVRGYNRCVKPDSTSHEDSKTGRPDPMQCALNSLMHHGNRWLTSCVQRLEITKICLANTRKLISWCLFILHSLYWSQLSSLWCLCLTAICIRTHFVVDVYHQTDIFLFMPASAQHMFT